MFPVQGSLSLALITALSAHPSLTTLHSGGTLVKWNPNLQRNITLYSIKSNVANKNMKSHKKH